MIKKLIFRNIRRSLGDYSIYFITLTLSISLIYAFLSLAFSEMVLNLSENMSQLTTVIVSISILVAGIVAFTVSYATKFIVSKRKKEFAIYQLLGMEQKEVSKLFFLENGLIGIIAYLAGIVLGNLLSQIFTAIILNIFDGNYEFEMIFSCKTATITFIMFVVMYLINIFKSSAVIKQKKVIDLLHEERFNEKPIRENKSAIILSLVAYGIVLVISLFIFKISMTIQDSRVWVLFVLSAVFIVIGIKEITTNFMYLFLLRKSQSKKWKYHKTNLVLLRQLSSQINSYGKTIGILAVLLFIALISMDFGLSMGVAYKANVKAEAPFDIAIGFDFPNVKNFNEIVEFINQKEPVKDYISYQIYESKDVPNMVIIALRDYNHLRAQLQLDLKNMDGNQYIIHSDTWSTLDGIKKNLENNPEICIDDELFTTNEELIFTEPFEQYRMNGINGAAIIVPDEIIPKLTPIASRLVVTTVNGAPQEMKSKLNQFVRKKWKPISDSYIENPVTMSISVKRWSVANGLTALSILSFGGLYFSLIIVILIGTIMALQEVYNSEKSKYQYKIIHEMGISKDKICRMIRKQLANTFSFPIGLPILFIVIFAIYSHISLGTLILQKNVIPYYTLITLIVFVVIYGLYYLATYKIYEKNVLNFINNSRI